MRSRSLIPILISLCVSTPAAAADGRLEINQTCATSTGCFSGDALGFPVTIFQPGSYVLTSSLDVTGETSPENVTAIDVNIDGGVAIDLNAFSLIGPGSSGTGLGIDAAFSDEVTVRNGTVRGFGAHGIKTDRRARIEGIRAHENGGDGIFADLFSIVEGNVATSNGEDGIDAGASTVRANSCHQNGADGINTGGSSTVSGNTMSFNTGDGIDVTFGSIVRGNTSRANTGFGLNNSAGTSGYAENAFDSNGLGQVSGGVQVGDNLCGAVICP